MDEEGQLVVRIESIEVDQKVLDSIETPCRDDDSIDINAFKDEVASACEFVSELGIIWKKYWNIHGPTLINCSF